MSKNPTLPANLEHLRKHLRMPPSYTGPKGQMIMVEGWEDTITDPKERACLVSLLETVYTVMGEYPRSKCTVMRFLMSKFGLQAHPKVVTELDEIERLQGVRCKALTALGNAAALQHAAMLNDEPTTRLDAENVPFVRPVAVLLDQDVFIHTSSFIRPYE